MNDPHTGSGWPIWRVTTVLLIGMLVAGGLAYNAGLSQGAAHVAQTVSTGATGAPAAAPYPYADGWHRGWGFGFVPFLLFFFFWTFLSRIFLWSGPWRHGWSGYGYGCGPYGWRRRVAADAFDDWHRDAHDRMKENRPADDPGGRR